MKQNSLIVRDRMKEFFLPILILGFIFSFQTISAFPFQVLPNGSLVDLNMTIEGVPVDIVLFNNTYFFVPRIETNSTNISIYHSNYNVTNITYQNITQQNLTNCTLSYFNNTNYSNFYILNGSNINNFTYTKQELDNKISSFITQQLANERYAIKSDFDNLVVRVNNISISPTVQTIKDSDTLLWIAIIIIGIIALISIFWERG
jgi:hypothetical protein